HGPVGTPPPPVPQRCQRGHGPAPPDRRVPQGDRRRLRVRKGPPVACRDRSRAGPLAPRNTFCPLTRRAGEPARAILQLEIGAGGSEAGAGGSETGAGGSETGAGGSETGAGGSEIGAGGSEIGAGGSEIPVFPSARATIRPPGAAGKFAVITPRSDRPPLQGRGRGFSRTSPSCCPLVKPAAEVRPMPIRFGSPRRRSASRGRGLSKGRLIIGAVIAIFALVSFFTMN